MKNKAVKLHLGCGEVYLDGYINIDGVGELASENPELVAEKITDVARYFKKPYKLELFGHDKRGRNVVDILADVTDLSEFDDNSADEMLSVNLIDHFRFQDLPDVMKEWRRVLKPGGSLIIDVGDAVGNAQKIVDAKTKEEMEWALRLMYCHSRDKYDSHHWGYSPKYLEQLMNEWGFTQLWTRTDYIEHVYPSFQSAFTKD